MVVVKLISRIAIFLVTDDTSMFWWKKQIGNILPTVLCLSFNAYLSCDVCILSSYHFQLVSFTWFS